MCGIAGFVRPGGEGEEQIKRMCAQMVRRGPDASGIYIDERNGVTLGHRRLAIQDLSENGAQPMCSRSGRFVISYNGEIYNAAALRERLLAEKKVPCFRGTSDTEAILEAMEAYGPDAVKEMKGMFAMALYDKQEETLYLYRDRAGEKPLYYGMVGGSFAFASDLACLRAMDGFSNEISRNAFSQYLYFGYIPAPLSIYNGIYKLTPGCMLTLQPPFIKYTIASYWTMEKAARDGQEAPFTGTFEEAADELDRLLTGAVGGQMISDVPLGAFLSGGTDSPLIVSLMQKQSSRPVKTFTIGFSDPRYDEAEYARAIARHLGTEHTQLVVSEKELLDVVPKLPEIFTEPFADSSQIPTYLVSRLAKSEVTVSLSGDGGDELFCGYNTYPKTEALWQKLQGWPAGLRHAAGRTLSGSGLGRKQKWYRVSECLQARNPIQLFTAVTARTDYYADLVTPMGKLPNDAAASFLKDLKSGMMYHDMMLYHPDDILVKVDRAGMAVSLENRVPMLDRDVIEFAWRLPMEYKYQEGVSKRILKEVLYRYVPKELLDRPKKGFSVPLASWLSGGPLSDWLNSLLEESRLAYDGYAEQQVLHKLLREFRRNGSHVELLWRLACAEQWYRMNGG